MITSMKIVSIDIGLVSLGYCTWNSINKKYKFGICNVREMCPKQSSKDYCLLAKTFLDTRKDIFKGANIILLERQLQAGMKQFTSALRAFLWETGKVYLISPITVKRYLGTSMGNYKKNKDASIEMFQRIADNESLRKFSVLKKKQKTDVADAYLQMHWYLLKNNLFKGH